MCPGSERCLSRTFRLRSGSFESLENSPTIQAAAYKTSNMDPLCVVSGNDSNNDVISETANGRTACTRMDTSNSCLAITLPTKMTTENMFRVQCTERENELSKYKRTMFRSGFQLNQFHQNGQVPLEIRNILIRALRANLYNFKQ